MRRQLGYIVPGLIAAMLLLLSNTSESQAATKNTKSLPSTDSYAVQSQYSLKMGVGIRANCNINDIVSDEKITYEVSDPNILTVDKKGMITSKKAGNAVVSVQCGSKVIYRVNVEVTDRKDDNKEGERFKASLGEYTVLTDLWEVTWGFVMITVDEDNLYSCVAGVNADTASGTRLAAESTDLVEMTVDYDWDRTGDVYVNIATARNPGQKWTVNDDSQSEGAEIVFMPADGSPEQTFSFDGCGDGFYIKSSKGMYLTNDGGILKLTEDVEKATQFTFFAVNLETEGEEQ